MAEVTRKSLNFQVHPPFSGEGPRDGVNNPSCLLVEDFIQSPLAQGIESFQVNEHV